jgi:hypothetical protein
MDIQICFRGNSKPFTPRQASPVTCMWVRQNSGLDRYAHVELLLEPIFPIEYHSRFSWEVAETDVPFDYFDAILEGIKRAVESDESPYDFFKSTRIRVVGGSYNETDSSPNCYMRACYVAIKEYLLESARVPA